jgi:hypothetical protein
MKARITTVIVFGYGCWAVWSGITKFIDAYLLVEGNVLLLLAAPIVGGQARYDLSGTWFLAACALYLLVGVMCLAWTASRLRSDFTFSIITAVLTLLHWGWGFLPGVLILLEAQHKKTLADCGTQFSAARSGGE